MTLLSRVEALTGPDRDVDEAIATEFGLWSVWREAEDLHSQSHERRDCDYFTDSVDAALAFAEKVLPGIRKRKTIYEAARHNPFCVWFDDADEAAHVTEPLAIILAVLRAKEGT